MSTVRDSTRGTGSRPGITHDLPGDAFRLINKDVAYLKLSSFRASKAEEYVRLAAGTRCFVVDIRNYPSEFAVFSLGQYLVSDTTSFVRFTVGDLSNPGAFSWGEPLEIEPATPRYTGRVVILVDEIIRAPPNTRQWLSARHRTHWSWGVRPPGRTGTSRRYLFPAASAPDQRDRRLLSGQEANTTGGHRSGPRGAADHRREFAPVGTRFSRRR